MSYPEYNLTKMYWKNYVKTWCEVYTELHNQLKELYEDETALAAAVATGMIAFNNASGMAMTGIVSWDSALAESDKGFKTFAEIKAGTPVATGAPKTGSFGNTGNSGQSQGGYKKPYDNTKELTGAVTQGQLDAINGYLNSKTDSVREKAQEMLEASGVAAPEELSKQDASNIIGACKALQPKKAWNNNYRN